MIIQGQEVLVYVPMVSFFRLHYVDAFPMASLNAIKDFPPLLASMLITRTYPFPRFQD